MQTFAWFFSRYILGEQMQGRQGQAVYKQRLVCVIWEVIWRSPSHFLFQATELTGSAGFVAPKMIVYPSTNVQILEYFHDSLATLSPTWLPARVKSNNNGRFRVLNIRSLTIAHPYQVLICRLHRSIVKHSTCSFHARMGIFYLASSWPPLDRYEYRC